MSGYSPSTFSRVYSGCVGLASAQHTVDTLASLTSLLRPGGQLTFLQVPSIELETNLREVSQCPEKAPTRAFSLLKVVTNA